MKKRYYVLFGFIIPFIAGYMGIVHLRAKGILQEPELMFTSSYKGCQIPMLDVQSEDFKTVEYNNELVILVNPGKSGEIIISPQALESISITADKDKKHDIKICPDGVQARVTVYEISPEFFDSPVGPKNRLKFKTTFEDKEVNTVIDDKKLALIKLENFPSK